MNTVFITGVSGFAGTNLVDHLTKGKDFTIYGHSRTPDEQQHLDAKITFVPDYTQGRLKELKIKTFIHLAGIAHDLSNKYTTEDYDRVNFEGTRKAVDSFLQSDAEKFIFVSSIKALCDTSSIPAVEQMITSPQTDYGKSKLKAEEYIRSVDSKTTKQFYILRPSMMHGPGNKGNLNLLYRFCKTGLPFPFGAFSNRRSFHSIQNFNVIVQCIIEKKILPGTYHLADDGFISTTDLYTLIGESIGRRTRVLLFPKGLVQWMAGLIGKRRLLQKLTEDMAVSNKKIVDAIGCQLPVGLREGLIQTVKSFDRK